MTSSTWRGPGWRTFAADPASGKTVRDWITRVIAAHPCPVDAPDAALAASELFGNAVSHGGGSIVLVAYLLWPGGARIVVCDHGGPTLPRLREPGDLTEGGRGLHVIDALAARWGSFRAAPAQVVWCDLGQPLPAAGAEAWAWLTALLAASPLDAKAAEPRTAALGPARCPCSRPDDRAVVGGGQRGRRGR